MAPVVSVVRPTEDIVSDISTKSTKAQEPSFDGRHVFINHILFCANGCNYEKSDQPTLSAKDILVFQNTLINPTMFKREMLIDYYKGLFVYVGRYLQRTRYNDSALDFFDAERCADAALRKLPKEGEITVRDVINQVLATAAAEFCERHYIYALVGGQVLLAFWRWSLPKSPLTWSRMLHAHERNGVHAPLIDKRIVGFIAKHDDEIQKLVNDMHPLYFFTAAASQFRKNMTQWDNKFPIEHPVFAFVRLAACNAMCEDEENQMDHFREVFLALEHELSPSTPVLNNSGKPDGRRTLTSCNLIPMYDSLDDIFDTKKTMAMTSKGGGGLGVDISRIRAAGTYIAGTEGRSNGVMPMLETADAETKYVDQGGGKRPGACNMQMMVNHKEIMTFIPMCNPNTYGTGEGARATRCIHLNNCVIINDDFIKAYLDDDYFYLACPHEVRDPATGRTFADAHGDELHEIYEKYKAEAQAREARGIPVDKVKARDIMNAISASKRECGRPYVIHKDAMNRQNPTQMKYDDIYDDLMIKAGLLNVDNINEDRHGDIDQSNLCVEIMQTVNPKEFAMCTITTICLWRAVSYTLSGVPYVNHDRLFNMTRVACHFINNVLDRTDIAVKEYSVGARRWRSVGIGIQDFQGMLHKLQVPYTSREALQIRREVQETIYFAALTESCRLAQIRGMYPECPNNPAMREGKLQFHMRFDSLRGVEHVRETYEKLGGTVKDDAYAQYCNGRWDWPELIAKIQKHGLCNAHVTSIQPTQSSAMVRDNMEADEALKGIVVERLVGSGKYTVVTSSLMDRLAAIGLWDDEMHALINEHHGDVADIERIPQDIRDEYVAAYAVPLLHQVAMHSASTPFVDQSKSQNLFADHDASTDEISEAFMYTALLDEKTINYYLRIRPAGNANVFAVSEGNMQECVDALSTHMKGDELASQPPASSPTSSIRSNISPMVRSTVPGVSSPSIRAAENMVCSLDAKEGCLACQ